MVSGAGALRVQPPLMCRRRCLKGILFCVKAGLAHVERRRGSENVAKPFVFLHFCLVLGGHRADKQGRETETANRAALGHVEL